MDNEVYYYDVGEGRWTGRFDFEVTDWPRFFRTGMSAKNRALAMILDLAGRLPGASKMQAEIRCAPEADGGVARIEVSVQRFGLEIYRLRGHYGLEADGHGVQIAIQHRYGPHGMPWSDKVGSATITEGGYRADYDMRLLGQDAHGVYEIEDPRRLAAAYDLGWGRCLETMYRVGPSKPSCTRSLARWASLLDAARDLEDLERAYDAARDPRAPFCHVYGYFVRDLAYHLEAHDFEDPDWVVRLGCAFVLLFVEAMEAIEAGAGPNAWRTVIEAMQATRFTALEELALGMLVHIAHDLPHALCMVGMHAPDGRSRIHDYDLVNAQLGRAIDPLQDRLSARYTPLAGFLDGAMGRLDEALTRAAIEAARARAWYDGERLAAPATRDEAKRDIEASIGKVLSSLRGRGPLGRLARGAVRAAVRPARRWPIHPGPRPTPSDGGATLAGGTSDGLHGFFTAPETRPLLGPRGRAKLRAALSAPAASEREVPGAQSALHLLLREGFDAAQGVLESVVASLDAVGVPAGEALATFDDPTSGYDPSTDVFTARAAALFGAPLEAVEAIVDPARWPNVIDHVEDAYWIDAVEQDGLRTGRFYERVNILAPWIPHHPLVLETELHATLSRTPERARIDFSLARSLDGNFDIDEGFIEARRIGPSHTAVTIDKRLRVRGHELLYALLRANPDGLARLMTHWIHSAARTAQSS